jgi:predicted glycosyltransferase involved in capsule biosynthesis
MTRFSIIIPWRTDSGPREELMRRVVNRWTFMFGTSVDVWLCDSGAEEFNRSASRNAGAERAHGDVLVFADADTFIPFKHQLITAIDIVSRRGGWAHPFTWYHALKEEPTEALKAKLDSAEGRDIPIPTNIPTEFCMKSWAGILVIGRSNFEAVGGYDERFQGWGYEDTAFKVACDTLIGAAVRVQGDVYHLWHPAPISETWDQPWAAQNNRILDRYNSLAGNKEAMHALILERAL